MGNGCAIIFYMENFQAMCDDILKGLSCSSGGTAAKPRLLLHACCAPCSSYTLEYLNGYVPPAATKSKKWLWILIAAIVIIAVLAILLARSCNKEPQVITQETIVEKVVHDTVYLQQIEEIEDNFNAAEFQKGKADLPEAAKFVLHDLAKVLEKNPQVKLRLEGHTSAEGDADFNQKLSEARAQAAVDFLINHEGIDANRLEAIGFGSTQLKNTDGPMAPENRRTEFIVVEESIPDFEYNNHPFINQKKFYYGNSKKDKRRYR